MTKKTGFERWLPRKNAKPYFGLDREKPAIRLVAPKYKKSFIQKVIDWIKNV